MTLISASCQVFGAVPAAGAPIAPLAAGAFMTKMSRAVALLFLAGCTARGTVTVGGSCTIDESCITGVCLRETKTQSGQAWLGGYCSGLCDATKCPVSEMPCVTFADGHSYCTSECSDNSHCRSGYVCSKAVSACLPDCRQGWSCGSALSCDQGTGECVAPDSVQATVPLGQACELNVQCQSGLCIPQSVSGWSAGTCSQDCANDTDCPSGFDCMHFATGDGRCLLKCSAPADCRTGYVCDTDVSMCLPDCRNGWACLAVQRCDAVTGMCKGSAVADAGITWGTSTATAQSGTNTLSRTHTGTSSGAGAGSGFRGGTATGRGIFASPLVPRALFAARTSTATSWGTGIDVSTATAVGTESR